MEPGLRIHFHGSAYDAHREYWRKIAATIEEPLSFPRFPNAAISEQWQGRMSDAAVQQLSQKAKGREANEWTLLLAALGWSLSQIQRSLAPVLMVPAGEGAPHPQWLPLLLEVDASASLRTHMARSQKAIEKHLSFAQYPLELLEPPVAHHLQTASVVYLSFGKWMGIAPPAECLHLHIEETETNWLLHARSKHLQSVAIEALAGVFDCFLQALHQPDQLLSLVPAGSPAQVNECLNWGINEKPWPSDQSVSELFRQQVKKSAHAPAVWSREGSFTYAQLGEAVDRLAAHLHSHFGIGREMKVAVLLDKNHWVPPAWLAVLQCGAAYVPLDPKAPAARTEQLLQATGARLVLTQSNLLSALDTQLPVFVMDLEMESLPAPTGNGPPVPDAQCLAYIIFTSGSTGTPKGVSVEHRSIVRLVKGADYFQIGEGDALLQASSLAFDASTFEVYAPLLNGAKICFAEENEMLNPLRMESLIRSEGISHLWLTTAWLDQLVLTSPGLFAQLNWLGFGGERIREENVYRLGELHPHLERVHFYGPTENTTFSTWHPVGAGEREGIPIGRPIANSLVRVIASNGQPVPPFFPGEIVVGGPGLAREYLDAPELTQTRFFELEGERFYHTGDIGWWEAKDRLQIRGREDAQLKIRGHRIEPGEIATQLGLHAQAAQVFVSAIAGSGEDKELAVWFTGELSAAAGREWLQARLPAYMIPQHWIHLDSMPLTLNGKVNVKALPLPQAATHASARRMPATETEQKLAPLWCEALETTSATAEDDFFESGGHSLRAARLVARVNAQFGCALELVDVFLHPRLEQLAAHITRLEQVTTAAIAAGPPAEHYPLSPGQRRLWHLQAAHPRSADYNMPMQIALRGVVNEEAMLRALHHLVQRHEALRTVFRTVNGEPRQWLRPVQTHDVQVLTFAGDHAAADQWRRREAQRAFDLENEIPIRISWLRIDPAFHILAVTLHHIACDGWSLQVLLRELSESYQAFAAGLDDPLAPVALQYPAYSLWWNEWMQSAQAEAAMNWWRGRLGQYAPPMPLPLQENKDRSGADVWHQMYPAEVAEGLRQYARENGMSLFVVLTTLSKLALWQLKPAPVSCTGMVSAGRERAQLSGAVGFFVNTLVLREAVHAQQSVDEWMLIVKESIAGALQHQLIPIDALAEELEPAPVQGGAPFFEVLITFNEFGLGRHTQALSTEQLAWVPDEGSLEGSKFLLSLHFTEGEEGVIYLSLNFDTAWVGSEMVTELGRNLAANMEKLPQLSSLPLWAFAEMEAPPEYEMPLKAAVITAPRQQTHSYWQDEWEAGLAELWAALLPGASLHRETDFFQVGGHSLKAGRLAASIESRWGVQVSLREIFENPGLREMARLIAGKQPVQLPALEAVVQEAPVPLTAVQLEMWAAQLAAPAAGLNHVPALFQLSGVQPETVRLACAHLFAAHEALRYRFWMDERGLWQQPLPAEEIPFIYFYLSGQEQADSAAHEQAAAFMRQPFDLEKGPASRFLFISTGPGTGLLAVTLHHLVCDGWSVSLLYRDFMHALAAAERGETIGLPENAVTFSQYVHWQQQLLEGAAGHTLRAYWTSRLSPLPARLSLPLDEERPPVQTFAGAAVELQLNDEIVQALSQLCRREASTLFHVLLTGLSALLHRLTGAEDFLIGTPAAARQRREFDETVGCFVQLLPLRVEVYGDEPLLRTLRRVKAMSIEAMDRQGLPLQDLMELLAVPRTPGRPPLLDVGFTLQNANEFPSAGAGGAHAEALQVSHQVSKWDCWFFASERNGKLSLMAEYSVALFKEETMRRLLQQWQSMLRALAEQAAKPIYAIELGFVQAERGGEGGGNWEW